MNWRRRSCGKEAWSIQLTYSDATGTLGYIALGRKGLREQAWDAQTLHIPKKGLSPQLVFLETPGQLLGAKL